MKTKVFIVVIDEDNVFGVACSNKSLLELVTTAIEQNHGKLEGTLPLDTFENDSIVEALNEQLKGIHVVVAIDGEPVFKEGE